MTNILKNPYNFTEKSIIANTIKNHDYSVAIEDFIKLKNTDTSICLTGKKLMVGCKCCDYFTFIFRLDCNNKWGYSFYDFLYNIEYFLQKKYIQNYITVNKSRCGNKHINYLYYQAYTFYGASIGNFNIAFARAIYDKYKPKTTLDVCAGWGSRGIGALSCSVNYIGCDTNTDLQISYKNIEETLLPMSVGPPTFKIDFTDSSSVDFSKLTYDMVFTSPPYYNIEIYNGTNKKSIEEWNNWYRTVFGNSYRYLQPKGTFVLSINKKIYDEVCVSLLGQADEILPYLTSKNGKYNEVVYVWRK